MEVQEVKEQLKNIFRQVINNEKDEKEIDNSINAPLISDIKAIVQNCKPETEQDYEVLDGIKEILSKYEKVGK